MGGFNRPVDVVAWLRDEWVKRDLTHNDFNTAISEILKMEKGTRK